MASFMMGVGSPDGCFDFCPYEVPNSVNTQNFQFGGFIQDNWRVTPKLTLNLGIRYDVSLPRPERYDRQNWIDIGAVNPLNGGSVTYDDPITGDPVTRALLGAEVFAGSNDRYNFGIDWKDIQPRFGFAYQVNPKVVVRGGYGIYFSTTRAGAAGTGPINTYKGYDQLTDGPRPAPSRPGGSASCCRRRRLVAGQVQVGDRLVVDVGPREVLRDVDDDRAGAPRAREVEGLVDDAGDLQRVRIMKECLTTGIVMPSVSVSWKPSVPRGRCAPGR